MVYGTMGTPNSGASASREQYEALDRPLFGESSRRDRVVNLVVGTVTGILVLVTLISAFVFPTTKVNAMNVYFALCILAILCSHLLLIYWYRQGDLEPKFRNMIYYNAFTVVLLCVCANLFIHIVDGNHKTKT